MTLKTHKAEPEVFVSVMINMFFFFYMKIFQVYANSGFLLSYQGDITSIPELADYVKVFK